MGKTIEEAIKNGYTDGTNDTHVDPVRDQFNSRQLNVTISAPVGTFFMRVIGISSITATRASKAEYVAKVPMGSPQNYYGVGLLTIPRSTGYRPGTPTGSGSLWTTPASADATARGDAARGERFTSRLPARAAATVARGARAAACAAASRPSRPARKSSA